MIEPFQNEQKKAAAAAEIEDPQRRAAMKFQILDPLAIDPQPLIDVGIFSAGVMFLDFDEPVLIDADEDRPKRQPKNGTLRPAPATPISFRTSQLGQLSMQLHLIAPAISRSNPGPR